MDQSNPTVVSKTGYPLCVPRVAPGADPAVETDPLCPQKNRPLAVGDTHRRRAIHQYQHCRLLVRRPRPNQCRFQKRQHQQQQRGQTKHRQQPLPSSCQRPRLRGIEPEGANRNHRPDNKRQDRQVC